MPDQIYIGNFAKGLKTNRPPFVIDNDAFPYLNNMYIWRGRAKRKRGTITLGQLQIQVQMVNAQSPTPISAWQYYSIQLETGSFPPSTGNLITQLNLGASATIVPGTLSLIGSIDGKTYIDTTSTGILTGTGGGGTVNYATGQIFLGGEGNSFIYGTFNYYPGNPVMGLEDFIPVGSGSNAPLLLAFDTTNSYQYNQTTSSFYNTSFYKYSQNPVVWTGADYQQFWSTNYPFSSQNIAGSLWATNNNPGMHFLSGTYISGSGTKVIEFQFNFPGTATPFTTLVANPVKTLADQLWFNEWNGTPPPANLNGFPGYVSAVINAATGTYQVTFDNIVTVTSPSTGIAQMLTNSLPNVDGIRWYDGDPTNLTGLPALTGTGWVNFSPPLTAQLSPSGVIVDDLPLGVYYLAGALAILPFKDRLLFFSPYLVTSGNPNTFYQLEDTVLWSWNGTPYYTNPVPKNQMSNVKAYYVDQTGLGGYLPAGIPNPIQTISNNEDVLLIGFGGDGRKTRFIYTGNDLQPFLFYSINSELPSSATFSAVTLDKGALDIGQYGLAMTDQQSSQRVDLEIPDIVFSIRNLDNGAQRVNSQRDFFNEWIYFSYPTQTSQWYFPTQTLLFNYRDNTWAILYENYTKHGLYRTIKKRTWLNTGFASWMQWRVPWNSPATQPGFPQTIAGNPQGYVLIIGVGTGEAPSGTVLSVTSSGGVTQIGSINHCVNVGDYLLFQNCLGLTGINGVIGRVTNVGTQASPTPNSFIVDIPFPSGTYGGLGTYTRLSQPTIQTKQFPVYFDQGRQVRILQQKYLLDYTAESQITANIYLSMDANNAWNDPNNSGVPNGLIYSQLVYTCPETTNIGLTPANTNLQTPTSTTQAQIWHRMNTSLIGDTFQIGLTLDDAQMRNLTYATTEITLHGMQFTVERGPFVA